ncbi:hypothetical protein MPSEU_001106800 [Mayamaea pseudoterrestris]|nr:hypothetical protein MPSEU_001106800 [Mayamaea pseudoterrestris]
MVVIRKESLQRGRLKRTLLSLGRFLRFLLLASLIPLLFWIRWYIRHDALSSSLRNHDATSMRGSGSGTFRDNKAGSSWRQVLRETLTFHSHESPPFEYNDEQAFAVLASTLQDNNYPQNYLLSSVTDMAELYYCQVDDIVKPQSTAYFNFTSWAKPLLNESVSTLMQRPTASVHMDLLQQEFVLELLELYAQQTQRCDYSKYKYSSPINDKVAATKLKDLSVPVPSDAVRIAYAVIVHDDVRQLEKLLAAIVEPWHYIILHVERLAPASLVHQVKQIASRYNNVVMLQFGTVVYKTDSVSMVNLRIMQWLVHDLALVYDYHVTTGASAYPLHRNVGRALYAQQQQLSSRRVWLGETLLRGQVVYGDQSYMLKHKRLVYTRGTSKLHVRLSRLPFQQLRIPDEIQVSMMYKTNSGNQGVYAYSVVQELLESLEVKQLFVMSKYACCCCLEERNWIAALDLIGHGAEAREQAAVFQVWGGVDGDCSISMKNALLSTNSSLCYRMEDATLAQRDGGGQRLEFRGNETIDYLKDAKARGILFARKFQFDHAPSMEVLRLIVEEIW